MFYLSAEFEGDLGRYREARGFTTAAAREVYAAALRPMEGDSWSDYEEWEAPASEWPHIRVI